MTTRTKVPITSAAAARKKHVAAKEAAMSPQAEQLKIPATLSLRPRATCQPTDERQQLRLAADPSRVMAVVEAWRPELATN